MAIRIWNCSPSSRTFRSVRWRNGIAFESPIYKNFRETCSGRHPRILSECSANRLNCWRSDRDSCAGSGERNACCYADCSGRLERNTDASQRTSTAAASPIMARSFRQVTGREEAFHCLALSPSFFSDRLERAARASGDILESHRWNNSLNGTIPSLLIAPLWHDSGEAVYRATWDGCLRSRSRVYDSRAVRRAGIRRPTQSRDCGGSGRRGSSVSGSNSRPVMLLERLDVAARRLAAHVDRQLGRRARRPGNPARRASAARTPCRALGGRGPRRARAVAVAVPVARRVRRVDLVGDDELARRRAPISYFVSTRISPRLAAQRWPAANSRSASALGARRTVSALIAPLRDDLVARDQLVVLALAAPSWSA